MIIIGTLAAIAIPTFLTQRAKARDTSTVADVSNVGKEIASYFVDGNGVLTLDFSTLGRVTMTDGAGFTTTVNLTNGTAQPTSGGSANLGSSTSWCVSLTDSAGSVKSYTYSASSGLGLGTCP
jgi:type II secretory pathway pseudopilin PulG